MTTHLDMNKGMMLGCQCVPNYNLYFIFQKFIKEWQSLGFRQLEWPHQTKKVSALIVLSVPYIVPIFI